MHWADEAIDRMAAPEVAARVRQLIDELPPAQRQVVMLRDVEGLPAADVSGILGITDGNQRVLLHRARARIRRYLEQEACGEHRPRTPGLTATTSPAGRPWP